MGLTVIDAGVLIGFLDGRDLHHDAAEKSIRAALDRNEDLALPASAFAEALVGPARLGDRAVATVRELIDRLPIGVVPLNDHIAIAAAQLRARHRSIKLPDALVIATAVALDADHLVTTDRKWPSRRQLGVTATISTL